MRFTTLPPRLLVIPTSPCTGYVGIKRVLAATLSLLLPACTSALVSLSGVLTPEDATSYASFPPEVFVKKRFFEESQTPVLDAVENAVDRYAKTVNAIQGHSTTPTYTSRKPEISMDGAMVTWPAYFSDSNYIQLLRPVVELKRYCLARNQEWQLIETYSDDPVMAYKTDPVGVFLDTQNRVTRMLAARGAYVGFEEIRTVVAANVGREMMEESERRNQYMARAYSEQGLRYAVKLNAFGVFRCAAADESGNWYASVLPTTLFPNDPNTQLTSSMMRIAVRIYAAPSQRAASTRRGG
jgi:hypothetical protein